MELAIADEIRSIATQGLLHAKDPFARVRYERLLEISAKAYSDASTLTAGEVSKRFRDEVGYPTAKVGVDAAIFGDDLNLLLIRRSDSRRWALPGGWVDPGQTALEAVAREVREETCLTIKPETVIAVNSQLPDPNGSPHTSVHVLYHCVLLTRDAPVPTEEAIEVGYFDIESITDWEPQHGDWAAEAIAWRRSAP